MDQPRFREIDVGHWTIEDEEPLGTKPKRWLLDPETRTEWLMKDVTFNRRADGSEYAKGDDWAERIANAVAIVLGLPTATVELASGGHGIQTSKGVISRKLVSDDESLIHGNELLEEIGVIGEGPRDRTGYTLEAVRTVLDHVDPPSEAPEYSAWEVFVGYLVLDALIGNVDRHQENWAAIALGSSRRLAPSFDHASCLGFQLPDEQRIERLQTRDSNYTPEAYAERARSRFQGKPSPMGAAIEGLESVRREVRDRWLEPCSNPETVESAIEPVPSERISGPAREFARRMLRHNATRLCHTARVP